MMRKFCVVLLCVFIMPLICGCGPARPENMPQTAPCTVSVFKDGVPVPDVEVSLYREGGNGALSIGANTNSQGEAIIRSSWGKYSAKGAPVGKNKVTIMQYFVVPGALSSEELERLSPSEQAKYEIKYEAEFDKHRPIPKELSFASLTSLEIDVQPKHGGSLKIDLKDYGATDK